MSQFSSVFVKTTSNRDLNTNLQACVIKNQEEMVQVIIIASTRRWQPQSLTTIQSHNDNSHCIIFCKSHCESRATTNDINSLITTHKNAHISCKLRHSHKSYLPRTSIQLAQNAKTSTMEDTHNKRRRCINTYVPYNDFHMAGICVDFSSC